MESFEEFEKGHLVTNLPQFFKDFLNKFVHTRFYKKTFEEDLKYSLYPEADVKDKEYLSLDWSLPNVHIFNESSCKKTLKEKIKTELFMFGKIPSYKFDKIKYIWFDMKEKKCGITTGICYGLWGDSRGWKATDRATPKYMQPLIDEFWAGFHEYLIEAEQ